MVSFIAASLALYATARICAAGDPWGWVWLELGKLTASDPEEEDEYGSSVAAADKWIVVGAPGNNAAYVIDATTGLQKHKLSPELGTVADFGSSASISGNLVAVGAVTSDVVYLFEAHSGSETWKVTPPGSTPQYFGCSVSVDGKLVAIGALLDGFPDKPKCGTVYLLDQNQVLYRMWAADATADDAFGASVSISGTLLAVGAPGDDVHGTDSGSAYVFDVLTHQQIKKFSPQDGAAQDVLGVSIAIFGDLVAVGAPLDDDKGEDSGSVYLFHARSGQQLGKLLATDGNPLDYFGYSVAISGDLLLIGAPGCDDAAPYAGAAYLFDLTKNKQLQKLIASDGATADLFGSAVAISGGLVVAGAPQQDQMGEHAGAAYAFMPFALNLVSQWEVGGWPSNLKGKNLDGDNDDDLITCDWYDNTISVLFNNGDGTFQPREVYEVGTGPWALATDDLDGDGDADVAVVNDQSDNVSILLNDGAGTFIPGEPCSVGEEPVSVVIADLDGDEDLDLATANFGDWTVSVLFNNGDGTFSPFQSYGVGHNPIALAIADLDFDEDPDLAVVNYYDNTVSILFNEDGSFIGQEVYDVGAEPWAIAIEDLDGDEDADLVVANLGDESVSVLLNECDGTFAPHVPYGVGAFPMSVAIDDLDEDGDPDVIVTNSEGDSVCMLLNLGDGTFPSPLTYETGPHPTSVVISDLDNDGDEDLAVTNAGDDTVGIMENMYDPSSFCPADLDGDGEVDAADLLHLLGCWGSDCGDVDGDGDTDTADLLALLAAWGECP